MITEYLRCPSFEKNMLVKSKEYKRTRCLIQWRKLQAKLAAPVENQLERHGVVHELVHLDVEGPNLVICGVLYLGVSKNRGTPKSSHFKRGFHINHPFWVSLFLATSIFFPSKIYLGWKISTNLRFFSDKSNWAGYGAPNFGHMI